MKDTFPLPLSLTPEWLKDYLSNTKGIKKLNELADRGIILNTWQANELLAGGRAYGRTYLAYVRLAEDSKERGISLNATTGGRGIVEQYDPDCRTNYQYQDFVRGFSEFLVEHYSDVFTSIEMNGSTLTAKPPVRRKRWFI